MKTVATWAIVVGALGLFASEAMAQSYYSRQSQQNRQYQSMQQSTQRAFAPQRTAPTYQRTTTPTTTRSRTYR